MSTKLIIYDFEVFKYDCLLGCYIIDGDTEVLYQTWDVEKIKEFYQEHINDVFIGHNNYGYDDHILEDIAKGMNPYPKSQNIINKTFKKKYVNMPLHSYDITNEKLFSLKLSELIRGKKVHETDVDFQIDRPLTEEEKKEEELYNKDDLDATKYNFYIFYDKFKLKIELIKEFKLNFDMAMHATGTKLAAMVLDAHNNPSLINQPYHMPYIKNLKIKDQEILNWYYNEEFKEGKTLQRVYGGCEVNIASGGAHGAIPNEYFKKALYFDVSGYYNLIMIHYDLLSRSVSETGKARYSQMYFDQLKMKKTNPIKRASYKTVLLAVFGGQINEMTDFYDPFKGPLVPVTGEVFLIDLMEKLDGLVRVVQYNTDGIIVIPLNWDDEKKIIEIVEEWEQRTGFTIKKDHIHDIWQRDVNCYIYFDDKDNLHYVGFTNYDITEKGYVTGKLFGSTDPSIITKGVIDVLAYDKTPEQVVEENLNDIRNFQYPCRKVGAEYMTYEFNGEKSKIQSVSRAFALKKELGIGKIYKYRKVKKASKKYNVGDLQKVSYSDMPESVFIYNDDVNNEQARKEILEKLDLDWYIKKIYIELNKFVNGGK